MTWRKLPGVGWALRCWAAASTIDGITGSVLCAHTLCARLPGPGPRAPPRLSPRTPRKEKARGLPHGQLCPQGPGPSLGDIGLSQPEGLLASRGWGQGAAQPPAVGTLRHSQLPVGPRKMCPINRRPEPLCHQQKQSAHPLWRAPISAARLCPRLRDGFPNTPPPS